MFKNEFYDVLMSAQNISGEYIDIALEAKRKVYILLDSTCDISQIQSLQLQDKVKQCKIFHDSNECLDFFKESDSFLPWEFCGEIPQQIKQGLLQIHQYRLTKTGRSDKNILLSICIPSYNRGERAYELIQELMQLKLDHEIEFIVSNNGSEKNIDGYTLIKNNMDARIRYNEFSTNQMFVGNFWKVLSMAKGQYALLISDEDHLILENLPQYLDFLKRNPSVGIVRSNCSEQNICYNTVEPFYTKAGDDAFLKIFLTNNYMSGIIYKTEMLSDSFINSFCARNHENQAFFYYPHLCLDMVLSRKYDYCKAGVNLFTCGIPEQVEIDEVCQEDRGLAQYQTIESRVRQHKGYVDILNQIEFDQVLVKVNAYVSACWKLFHLLYITNDKEYISNWRKVCIDIREICYQEIANLQLGEYMVTEVHDIIKEIIDQYYQEFANRIR